MCCSERSEAELLLLRRLLVLLACLANAKSAGKCPLYSELSMLAPALISDAKLVMCWMQSRVPVADSAPLTIISLESSSKGLSLT